MSHPPTPQHAQQRRSARPTDAVSVVATVELSTATVELIAERAAALVLEQLRQQPASPFMTIPEAASYLRCKRQRVDDLLSARRLTRFKDGRRTLLIRAELEALLRPTTGPRSRTQRPTG